jgi:hypothetical protein
MPFYNNKPIYDNYESNFLESNEAEILSDLHKEVLFSFVIKSGEVSYCDHEFDTS